MRGAVLVASRFLEWAEIQNVYAGPTSSTGVTLGGRYFSGLGTIDESKGGWTPYSGVGSVGRGWVHNFTERLFDASISVSTGGGLGQSHIRHLDWNRPYDNPEAYYVSDGSGTRWVAPTWAGGELETFSGSDYPNAAYRLTFKNGLKHYFNLDGQIVARANYSNKLAVRFEYDHSTTVFNPDTGMTEPVLMKVVDARGKEFHVTVNLSTGFIETIRPPSGDTSGDGDYIYTQDNSGDLI